MTRSSRARRHDRQVHRRRHHGLLERAGRRSGPRHAGVPGRPGVYPRLTEMNGPVKARVPVRAHRHRHRRGAGGQHRLDGAPELHRDGGRREPGLAPGGAEQGVRHSILVSEARGGAGHGWSCVRSMSSPSRGSGKACASTSQSPSPETPARPTERASPSLRSRYICWDFRRAGELYAALLEQAPADRAAQTMQRRAEDLATRPPPEGWDGVAVMTEK